MDALARIDAARLALERATSLDEVLDIRDLALRGEAACRAAGATTEVMNRAVALKLRAERIAGKWLSESGPKRGPNAAITNGTISYSLDSLGITPNQSMRWKRNASVPDEEFERYLASGKELTVKGLLQLAARQPAETKETQTIVHNARRVSSLEELSGEKFGTIYADPPWRYGNQATRASTDNHYDTMSVDDIATMPISELAADDSHLHIWTTNAFLPDTFRVIEAWGFEYRSCFVWVKPQMGIGNYWRVSHEFLLLGIRGDAKRFKDRGLTSWGEYERGKHSSKPEVIRELIERASPGPFLEMFGRTQREGWTVFGNQVSGDVQRRLTG